MSSVDKLPTQATSAVDRGPDWEVGIAFAVVVEVEVGVKVGVQPATDVHVSWPPIPPMRVHAAQLAVNVSTSVEREI